MVIFISIIVVILLALLPLMAIKCYNNKAAAADNIITSIDMDQYKYRGKNKYYYAYLIEVKGNQYMCYMTYFPIFLALGFNVHYSKCFTEDAKYIQGKQLYKEVEKQARKVLCVVHNEVQRECKEQGLRKEITPLRLAKNRKYKYRKIDDSNDQNCWWNIDN